MFASLKKKGQKKELTRDMNITGYVYWDYECIVMRQTAH